jgi:hypothetical protein
MTDQWLEQFQARRDARAQANREVKLLGTTLTVKPSIAPEVGLRLAHFNIAMTNYVTAYNKAQTDGTTPPDGSGYDDTEMLALSESVIADCLTTDSLPAWQQLRAPDAPEPLTLLEIYGLANYLVSRAAGLPTDAPTGSPAGQRNGQTSSKARSRSRAATPKT